MSDAGRAAAHRDAIAELGLELNPDFIKATIGLTAPLVDPAILDGVTVTSDIPYGDHERHVLDVYSSPELSGAPVVVYVHGGGFVAGQKAAPGSPYFGNIGGWAVRHGFVGVAINYRLAPEAQWPDGARDIGAALTWVVDRISEHGGDPERIFLVGQSAGAMHVADYVAQPSTHSRHGMALAGAAIISCIYDLSRAEDKPIHRAYWGDDPATWAEKSSLGPLLDVDLPLLLAVAEYDEPQFQQQAAWFVEAWTAKHGLYPPMHRLWGQNHLTSVYSIGTPYDTLGGLLEQFITANAGIRD